MSYIFESHEYVKICQTGHYYGDIGYITDRFQLPDPHPCNMYTIVIINATADEVVLPEEYLTDLETTLKDLENTLKRECSSKPCECGADKLGFSHHYTWCPKHRG